MNSIEQVSQTYLALVVATERKHRAAHPQQDPALMANRFWDARSIAKDAGIDDFAMRDVVRHLAAKDLLQWHDKTGRSPTIKLTGKGFSEPLPPILPVVARPHHPESNTATGAEIAAVVTAAIGLVAGGGGLALVFLSRVALAQGIDGANGRWKAVAGVAGLFIGGILLGASLRGACKLLASLPAQRRNPEPVGSEA